MAISACAKDILALLPDSLLDIDLPNEVSFELGMRVLSASKLHDVCTIFGDGVQCSIDFEHKMLLLTRNRVTFKQLRAVKSGLIATTESERAAVAFANNLDVIDYDSLVPEFHMESVSDATLLHIRRLLRVSHTTLLHQLPAACSCATTWQNARWL